MRQVQLLHISTVLQLDTGARSAHICVLKQDKRTNMKATVWQDATDLLKEKQIIIADFYSVSAGHKYKYRILLLCCRMITLQVQQATAVQQPDTRSSTETVLQ